MRKNFQKPLWVYCCIHLFFNGQKRLFVDFISGLCHCHSALRTLERKIKIFPLRPGLGENCTKSLIMTQPGWPAAAGGAAGLPRRSPAPIPGGLPGAWQGGPGALQGLQPKGNFGLEQTSGCPGRGIPLLVLPAQLGDRQKGEAMKVKPQRVHMVTSPTFTLLQMLIHHGGTFRTLTVASPV